MVLIGLFALVLLWATPAHAEPISLAILAALTIEATATAVAITSTILAFAASTALSFVSQALFKAPARSGGASAGGNAPTVDNKVTIRQAAAARPIVYGKTRVSGIYAFVHATDNNQNLRLVILFAGHEIEEFSEIWFNDAAVSIDWGSAGQVTSGPFAYKANVNVHLGAADQLADQDLIDVTGGTWTATDRLQGIAYLYVTLNFDAKVYTGGVPNITAVIKGKKVYDPRTGLTAWSANPALCLADYLCDTTYGVGVDYATGIDETALIAAANACDEEVALASGGTEARYRCDGAISSALQPQEIIGRLLGSMHGRAPYDGEQWKIIAGVYQTPVLSFTDDDLRAGPRIQTLTSRRDLFNSVKGTFTGPDNKWQEADFPPVKSALYKAQDGQEIWKDMALPMTRSASRAQRIAKIDLLRTRQQITAQMPCKLSVWRCQAGDTVTWTSARYGWVDKPFEVGKATFAVDSSSGSPTLGVDLELRETAAAIYDWSTDQESTVDPAPDSNFPAVFNPLPPTNLTAAESIYVARPGGGAKAKVTLAWSASVDAFVTSGGGYLVEFRVTGTTDWVPLPQTDALTLDILDITPETYDFRVFAVNWAANRSDTAATISGRPVVGLSDRPSAPTGLTVNASSGLAIARYDQATELDVLEGGSIVFRHSSLLTGATWADGVSISLPLPGNSSIAVLPLKAGTYLAKKLDSSGLWSESFASFVQAQASPHQFTTAGSVVEAPTFAGTKVGAAVSGSSLVLPASILLGDPVTGNVLGSPSLDTVVGMPEYTTGTYSFASRLDLGAVQRVRLTSLLASSVVNSGDTIGSRTGLISTWPSISGAVGGDEGDARLRVRATQTDPNGSPTWTAWERLDSADFSARGFEFELILERSDLSFTVAVTAASALAETVV